MQLAFLLRMISHFLWVFILGVKDGTNKCIFMRSQSELKHYTRLIPLEKSNCALFCPYGACVDSYIDGIWYISCYASKIYSENVPVYHTIYGIWCAYWEPLEGCTGFSLRGLPLLELMHFCVMCWYCTIPCVQSITQIPNIINSSRRHEVAGIISNGIYSVNFVRIDVHIACYASKIYSENVPVYHTIYGIWCAYWEPLEGCTGFSLRGLPLLELMHFCVMCWYCTIPCVQSITQIPNIINSSRRHEVAGIINNGIYSVNFVRIDVHIAWQKHNCFRFPPNF